MADWCCCSVTGEFDLFIYIFIYFKDKHDCCLPTLHQPGQLFYFLLYVHFALKSAAALSSVSVFSGGHEFLITVKEKKRAAWSKCLVSQQQKQSRDYKRKSSTIVLK